MDNSMWGFVGFIILFCGVYILVSYVNMIKKGEINASILLGRDYAYKKCKDKEAYIKKAGPALLVLGAACLLYGGLDVVHCFVYSMPLADAAGMVIFFIALVWFAFYTGKLRRQYF